MVTCFASPTGTSSNDTGHAGAAERCRQESILEFWRQQILTNLSIQSPFVISQGKMRRLIKLEFRNYASLGVVVRVRFISGVKILSVKLRRWSGLQERAASVTNRTGQSIILWKVLM